MFGHIISDHVQRHLPDIGAITGSVGAATLWLTPLDIGLKILVSILSVIALTLTIRSHLKKKD